MNWQPSSSESLCPQTKMAAHRGYAQNGKMADSSTMSIEQAINDGVKHIEIDITIGPGDLYLRHDNFSLEELQIPELIQKKYPQMITLQGFFEKYLKSFDTVFIDIKEINMDRSMALSLFESLQWPEGKDKIYFIGMSCRLLQKIRKKFAVHAGCESQGVFANWALGFDVWSVDYTQANVLQYHLNQIMGLTSVVWTFPTKAHASSYCTYQSAYALTDDAWIGN